MARERELPKITRRKFLVGAGLTALAVGCKRAEELVAVTAEPSTATSAAEPLFTATPKPSATAIETKQPTETPRPTETFTPEATPTPEVVRILPVTITAEYLKNAFADGGRKMVDDETSLISFGRDYVSESWGEEIEFTQLSEDPIASLKYLICLGSYWRKEGIFYPGKELFLPQIADLPLVRLLLEKVPFGVDQKRGGGGWFSPDDFLLRSGTQMTVVGLLNEPVPKDANEIEQELKFVLVAFTDYLRVSEKSDVPSHYFALIPACLPTDYREDKEALTLPNLLEVNSYDYDYDYQKKEITLTQNGQKTILELNQIAGEELTDWFSPNNIRKACGLRFVDQIKGELIRRPVVPYPAEMPRYRTVERVRDENGQISFLMWDRKGPDTEREDYEEVAQARYDSQKEIWVWGEVKLFEPTPIFTPEEEQQLKDIATRIYGSEENAQFNLQLIFFNLEEAGKIDLEELEFESDSHLQYYRYATAAETIKVFRVGSLSGIPGPEKSDPEILLKLLAKVREVARQNPHYNEEDWIVQGVDSY